METRSPSSITDTSEILPPGQPLWAPAPKEQANDRRSAGVRVVAFDVNRVREDLERLELVLVVLVFVGHGVILGDRDGPWWWSVS
jgi:hypothetical protein